MSKYGANLPRLMPGRDDLAQEFCETFADDLDTLPTPKRVVALARDIGLHPNYHSQTGPNFHRDHALLDALPVLLGGGRNMKRAAETLRAYPWEIGQVACANLDLYSFLPAVIRGFQSAKPPEDVGKDLPKAFEGAAEVSHIFQESLFAALCAALRHEHHVARALGRIALEAGLRSAGMMAGGKALSKIARSLEGMNKKSDEKGRRGDETIETLTGHRLIGLLEDCELLSKEGARGARTIYGMATSSIHCYRGGLQSYHLRLGEESAPIWAEVGPKRVPAWGCGAEDLKMLHVVVDAILASWVNSITSREADFRDRKRKARRTDRPTSDSSLVVSHSGTFIASKDFVNRIRGSECVWTLEAMSSMMGLDVVKEADGF